MCGGKGEQKSSETLGLLRLFSVFIQRVTVLFKKSFWKMLQHFYFLRKLRSARGPSGAPPGASGAAPTGADGSKASWQIALGPHRCTYTRVVVFRVTVLTVIKPQRDIYIYYIYIL